MPVARFVAAPDSAWTRDARRARLLAWASLSWMTVEGAVGVGAGAMAGSIALIGFGLDTHAQEQLSPEVGDGAAVPEHPGRTRLLGLAEAAQGALDPAALLPHEGLDVPERHAARNHHLDARCVDDDADAAGPIGAANLVGDPGQGD